MFFPHDEEVCLGNILSDDFNDLWQHHELLDKFRNKNILKGHCGGCKSRNICGGCRARPITILVTCWPRIPVVLTISPNGWRLKKGLPKGAQELADGRILIDLKYAG
nr:SPASM domain-containing protein [Methanobacterium formicicum]